MGFQAVVSSGAVDIIQPDPSHCGGVTEARKIAHLAEAYDVALAPHCPLGPIALAACLQIDAGCYNAVIQEQSLGIQYNTTNDLLDYLADPSVFTYRDGFVTIPRDPVSASRSTRSTSPNVPPRVTDGAIPSGDTTTVP